jgi:F0F1-type ATP synthase assembly protein I
VSQGDQELYQASKLTGLVGQIGCVTGFVSILIIGVAFGAGRFLDSTFETGGLFTILFLLGSFPITIYAIVRISLFAMNRAQIKNKDTESTVEEKSTT